MSDTLALATRLRDLDDEHLASIVVVRDIKPGSIKDFFDLAEALLDHAAIQRQLSHLDRPVLAAITALADLATGDGSSSRPNPTEADVAARLNALGEAPGARAIGERLETAVTLLLAEETEHGGFTVYDGVAQQLTAWPSFGLPSLEQLAAEPAPFVIDAAPRVDGHFVDRLASERAFATTTSIAEMLVELERDPARELAKGGVALPDSKRLANAMAVDLDTVPLLLALADEAGLVARAAGTWCATDAGGDWLLKSTGERWGALAEGWFRRLPGDIRSLLRERGHGLWGDSLRGFVSWLYPAAGEWMDHRVTASTKTAEILGITANQSPSEPGIALIAEGPDAAAAAMTALLPREVDRVYVQHDLSVVSPGPLSAGVDYRLRSLADVESRALASTWRISTSSLNRALAAGETQVTVREFLEAISLTGIPQPLDYLITEASARYGLVRVGSISGDPASRPHADYNALSYVSSDDHHLLGTIAVDQSLSALALHHDGETRLVSRYPLDTVFWNLSDARYPVAAEDAAGKIMALRRRRHARTSPANGNDPVRALIERLRLGSETQAEETGEAWLARQLDTAIRAKIVLTVSVRMPNGSTVDYQLEPLSVANGRMRARDARSAIERTLPISSIAAIAPAQDSSGTARLE